MSLPPYKLTIPVEWIDEFHKAMLDVWGGPPPRPSIFTEAPFLDELHELLLCSAHVTDEVSVLVDFDRLPILHGFLGDALTGVTTNTALRAFIAGIRATVWREAHRGVVDHLAKLA